MSVLINDNNQEIHDPRLILDMQRKFYQKLYTSNPETKFDAINNGNVRISKEDQEMADQPISIEELPLALKNICNGCCPDLDGLTTDFYKMFFSYLKEPLFQAICAGIRRGMLHDSALMGIINLIPKQGKDARFLCNLRPITLLNTDYKILEKLLANRLEVGLVKIVHTSQKGFMKNQRIAINIRKALDIIMYAEQEDLDAVILLVDFQKCFDMIEFHAIFGSLEFFNNGPNYINMIKVTYNNFKACV